MGFNNFTSVPGITTTAISNCYAKGSIICTGDGTLIGGVESGVYIGGIVGQNGSSNGNAVIENCKALNPSVTTVNNNATKIGRVAGENFSIAVSTNLLTNNYAFSGMDIKYNTSTDKSLAKGADKIDGADCDATGTPVTLRAPMSIQTADHTSVSIISSGNGTAVPINGTADGIFQIGTTITIAATPDEGYKFMAWHDENEELVSADAEYTFEVTDDITLVAVFEAER